MATHRLIEHRWWVTAEIDHTYTDPVDGVFISTTRRRFWKGRHPSSAQSRAINYLMETI